MGNSRFHLNHQKEIPTALTRSLYSSPEETGRLRFLMSSTAFHGALVALTFFLQIPKNEKTVVEIEYTQPQPVSKPSAVPVAPPVLGAVKPTAHKVAATPKPALAKPAVTTPPREKSPEPLETSSFEKDLAAPIAEADSNFDVDEIDKDLDQVQEQSAKEALNEQKNFFAHADSLSEDGDIAAQKIKKDTANAEKAKADASANARKKELVQALAAARAAEMKKAAEQNAARAAQAKAAAAAAAAKAESEKRAASAATAGSGSGGAKGNPNGVVRGLDELRQIPGNPRPAYSVEDRMAHRQGDITIYAYVSRGGGIEKIKLVQSSGHKTLDKKTLVAIQGWKFYPGQEGWVEIPFRWDLKGGPKEKPTTLRRKVSQNGGN